MRSAVGEVVLVMGVKCGRPSSSIDMAVSSVGSAGGVGSVEVGSVVWILISRSSSIVFGRVLIPLRSGLERALLVCARAL